jgi:hypothetical protein
VFALLVLSTMVLSIVNLKAAYAQGLSSSIEVKVDHKIIVHDGGLVAINDTVTLSKKLGEQPQPLQDFQIGFPYKYKFNLYQVSAYDSQEPQQRLTLDLDTGLGTVGFYGVKIHFKNEVDLNSIKSYNFTLVSEFSDLITTSPSTSNMFNLDFPVYPSLTQEASVSNTTVFLPPNANYTSSSLPFNQTTSHTLNIVKTPLAAFTSETGIISFAPIGSFSLLEVNEVKRDIALDEWNELLVSDFYNTTSRVANTSTLWVPLPKDAFDVNAKDDLGNALTVTQKNMASAINATITLGVPILQNQTAYFLVTFKLPWKDHISENGWSDFNLKFKLFEPMNLTVRKLTVTIDLPEGAKAAEFQSANEAIQSNILQMGIYQETPIFTLNNVSSYQDLNFTVGYTHAIFWASFRPTLWTGALVAVIAAIALLWQTRRAPTPIPTALPIRPEELRNYVKTYEEERKILQERDALEAQAQKGKIPRRLYRVRSRTLESRLSVLSRDLATLREKIRTAGPRYAGMMRLIEVSETELQGVEADIRRTEIRYRRGEISAAAYHKLLEDSYRRRDRAKTNIDGVLLRLREEIT